MCCTVLCCVLLRSAIGVYVVYLLTVRKVADGFGIRRNLYWVILYSNVGVLSWIALNLAWPSVNQTFESALLLFMYGCRLLRPDRALT